jgi:hypothetical protein
MPSLAYLFEYHRYGLGTCYLRMSKIRLAEYHYRKAVEIHPKNAVLLGCVGMVCLKSYVLRSRSGTDVNRSVLFFSGCRTTS